MQKIIDVMRMMAYHLGYLIHTIGDWLREEIGEKL